MGQHGLLGTPLDTCWRRSEARSQAARVQRQGTRCMARTHPGLRAGQSYGSPSTPGLHSRHSSRRKGHDMRHSAAPPLHPLPRRRRRPRWHSQRGQQHRAAGGGKCL